MITDEQLYQLLEERLPQWAKHGHDPLIWKFAELMKKYYDPSRVIKITYKDLDGQKNTIEVNSNNYFELNIESEDE